MRSEKSWKKPERGLIVSLDLSSPEEALEMAQKIKDYADVFKVPAALAIEGGAEFLKSISSISPLFLDLKVFDIPNTMELIVERASKMGVSFITAHALMGEGHLRKVCRAAAERGIRLLAVTVLTSMRGDDVPYGVKNVKKAVRDLAEIAVSAGAWGLVCSVEELTFLENFRGKLRFICPGIRPSGSSKGDQKRVATPSQAGERGADFIVVGRPIIKASDPVQMAARIRREFFEGISGERVHIRAQTCT